MGLQTLPRLRTKEEVQNCFAKTEPSTPGARVVPAVKETFLPVFPPIWPDEPGLRTWERKLSVRMRQRCDLRRGNAQREHLTAQEWVDSDSRTATSKGKGIWWATASLWAPTSQHRPAEPICAYGAMARATAIRKLFFQSSRGDAAARANAHSRRRS